MEQFIRRRGRRLALSALVGVAGTLAIGVGPAAAESPYSSYGGFVWGSQPTSPRYNPPADYSSDPRNEITRSAVGTYTVRLVGQASAGGVAHVAGYGSDSNYCKVTGWWPHAFGVDQLIQVRCFNRLGTPADAYFTASYHRAGLGSTTRLAYAWADNPTSASYAPTPAYQRNGNRGTITVARTATGRWSVTVPGMATSGGNVQVTAYGNDPARCKVASWYPSGTNEIVNVACHSASGLPADTRFTLSLADRVSLFGRPGNEQVAAYAWAPTSGSLPPAYSWNYRGLTNVLLPDYTGVSRVRMPEVAFPPTHAQVTGYGTDASYCKIGGWSVPTVRTVDVQVQCFAPSGTRVNSAFSVAFAGSVIPW
jgi:hypothetical protein